MKIGRQADRKWILSVAGAASSRDRGKMPLLRNISYGTIRLQNPLQLITRRVYGFSGLPLLSFYRELNLLSALLAKVFSLRTVTTDSENQHVLVDGRVVSMTRSQARRYRELKCIDSGFSIPASSPTGKDRA